MLFRFWVFPDCTFLDISNQQLQDAVKIKGSIGEQREEFFGLLLGQGIDRLFFFLGTVNQLHRIFDKQLLLFSETENQVQCVIQVVQCFWSQRLSVLILVLGAKVGKAALNIEGADSL